MHFSSFSSPTPDSLQDSQSSIGSPSSRVGPQIIGAEDDDFDTEQEQVGMTCSLSHSSSHVDKSFCALIASVL